MIWTRPRCNWHTLNSYTEIVFGTVWTFFLISNTLLCHLSKTKESGTNTGAFIGFDRWLIMWLTTVGWTKSQLSVETFRALSRYRRQMRKFFDISFVSYRAPYTLTSRDIRFYTSEWIFYTIDHILYRQFFLAWYRQYYVIYRGTFWASSHKIKNWALSHFDQFVQLDHVGQGCVSQFSRSKSPPSVIRGWNLLKFSISGQNPKRVSANFLP